MVYIESHIQCYIMKALTFKNEVINYIHINLSGSFWIVNNIFR